MAGRGWLRSSTAALYSSTVRSAYCTKHSMSALPWCSLVGSASSARHFSTRSCMSSCSGTGMAGVAPGLCCPCCTDGRQVAFGGGRAVRRRQSPAGRTGVNLVPPCSAMDRCKASPSVGRSQFTERRVPAGTTCANHATARRGRHILWRQRPSTCVLGTAQQRRRSKTLCRGVSMPILCLCSISVVDTSVHAVTMELHKVSLLHRIKSSRRKPKLAARPPVARR